MGSTRKSGQKAEARDRRPANKGRKYPAEVLTEAEVGALLRVCSGKAPTGVRNRALITVLYRAGLRVSEALALRPQDVDADAGAIAVLHGRGARRRVVPLDSEAFGVMARWLDRRSALGLDARGAIFCTLRGAPLKSAYVRALLPRLADRAGVEKRVHPHGLRHTHASELAREGTPLNLLQAQLGHASAATTVRYLKHIAPAKPARAPEARIWTPEED